MHEIVVKGVQATVAFDGEWITITKKPFGQRPTPYRLRAADISGTRYKPANRLVHGYVQFLLPGSLPAPEKRPGFGQGGRPPASDPHSLSIPRRSNRIAQQLVAAVEAARLTR